MSSRWLLALLLVPLLSSNAFSQKLINGFTREFAIQGLPAGFSLKSFDVTGDSVSELLVIKGNRFLVYDGRTFNLLFQDSTAPGTANLSPADVNRDDTLDLVATNGGSSVIVWFGPDFLNRSVFSAPVGSGIFAVRNREDGQVEFSFGFGVEACDNPPPPDCPACNLGGYLRRYTDTTFVPADSLYLGGSPGWAGVAEVTSGGNKQLFLVEYDYTDHNCNPNYLSRSLILQRFSQNSTNSLVFYNLSCLSFCGGPRCPPPIWQPLVTANIDIDVGHEFIVFWAEQGFSCQPSGRWAFAAYDILTGATQWVRADSSVRNLGNIKSLFAVDLDEDGVQELLAYQLQSGSPRLFEYQTYDGTTLGFSELPFTPATILMGQLGKPPAPKVLLGHGDSVVVYRIGCTANKGDMNADGNITVFDVTLELNCAFLSEGDCNLCFADVNCDGVLTASDVVLELLAVFADRPFPCS